MQTPEPKRKKGQFQPKQIDTEKLFELSSIGCTNKEMATILGVSDDTLVRNHADLIARGREHAKESVRRMLWKHAQSQGNAIALRYLIHNILKEKLDDPSLNVSLAHYEKLTDEEIRQIIINFARKIEETKNEA